MTAGSSLESLGLESTDDERSKQYQLLQRRIDLLVSGEKDLTAVLATIACELHHGFDYYHWTVSCRY